jgi:hypothetical protein
MYIQDPDLLKSAKPVSVYNNTIQLPIFQQYIYLNHLKILALIPMFHQHTFCFYFKNSISPSFIAALILRSDLGPESYLPFFHSLQLLYRLIESESDEQPFGGVVAPPRSS